MVDLTTSGVDIAIRYGDGPYPDFDVTPLLADSFTPVFNPIMTVTSLADLLHKPLIDFQWRSRLANIPSWSRWFAAAGLAEPEEAPLLRFSDESHAIQAAVAGQGVALVSLPLVKNELEDGQLVAPFGVSVPGYQHHLLRRRGEVDASVTAVSQWLLSEAAAQPVR